MAGSGRPAWGGERGVPGRGQVGGATGPGLGEKYRPSPALPAHLGVDSSRPLLDPGLKSGLKPGVGRCPPPPHPPGQTLSSPFTSCAWGSPLGRANCLLLFDLNRVGLGFLLLWGHLSFLRLWPAAGADVGTRSVGSGAPRSPSPSRPGPAGCGAWWAARRASLPAPFGEFAQGWVRVLGPRTQGSPGPWASCPPVAPPRAEFLPPVPLTDNFGGWGVGSAEDSAAIGGTFTLLSSSSEILPRPTVGRGKGALSSLFTWKGSPSNRVVINTTPTKIRGGGRISSRLPGARVPGHAPPQRPVWGLVYTALVRWRGRGLIN